MDATAQDFHFYVYMEVKHRIKLKYVLEQLYTVFGDSSLSQVCIYK